MTQLTTREELLTTVRELREAIERDVAEAGEERAVQPGTFEDLSLKDVVAHLTAWRLMTAERLEAGLRREPPVAPWPDSFDEEDTDAINQWFFEQNRDKSLDQVMKESRETFDRVERAIEQMPDDDLFQPSRFDWVHWTDEGLGPAVVRGSWSHYHEEHETDIRSWLKQR
jgi:hypothetical protein